jgi:long-chain fatty acid transport protein
VYFSPAGLATQPGAISVGVSAITASNTFFYNPGQETPGGPTSISRPSQTVAVPHAFASYRFMNRLAAGIGAFAPYGLTLKWPVCPATTATAACNPNTNFEGRYTGYDNTLRGIYVQPTLAYDVIPGRLQVGAGVDYVHLNIDVHQRADAPSIGLRGTDVADVRLNGNGSGWTANASAILRLTPNASIGVRYMARTRIDLSGAATFVQIPTGTLFDPLLAQQFVAGGPLSNQGISTTITLPYQFVAGFSWRPVEPLNVLFDFQRTGWSSFNQFDIAFHGGAPDQTLVLNYRNTNTYRLGLQWDWNDALALRAGFRYNNAASPRATPFLPESERNYFALGAGYRFMRALSIDGSFQYIDQPARMGAVRPDEPVVGVYNAHGTIFGVTLAYHFGGAADNTAGGTR